MNEIASQGQLRMSYVRWALFTVPAIVFLGYVSGQIANSGYDNLWFAGLVKPGFMPEGWVFGAAWTFLYALMGLAIAVILHARGARMRGLAILLFLVQLAANYAWSFVFFRLHLVPEALWLIMGIFVAASLTTIVFARIRMIAAILMLPYLGWLVFAGVLTLSIDKLNPNAANLVGPGLSTHI